MKITIEVIVSQIKALSLSLGVASSDIYISAGGALMMLGVRQNTGDLDLSIPKATFDALVKRDPVKLVNTMYGPVYEYSPIIDLHVADHAKEDLMEVQGVWMPKLDFLIKQKESLASMVNRPVDKARQDLMDLNGLRKLRV